MCTTRFSGRLGAGGWGRICLGGCLPMWGVHSPAYCMLGYTAPCEQNDLQTGVKTLPSNNLQAVINLVN